MCGVGEVGFSDQDLEDIRQYREEEAKRKAIEDSRDRERLARVRLYEEAAATAERLERERAIEHERKEVQARQAQRERVQAAEYKRRCEAAELLCAAKEERKARAREGVEYDNEIDWCRQFVEMFTSAQEVKDGRTYRKEEYERSARERPKERECLTRIQEHQEAEASARRSRRKKALISEERYLREQDEAVERGKMEVQAKHAERDRVKQAEDKRLPEVSKDSKLTRKDKRTRVFGSFFRSVLEPL